MKTNYVYHRTDEKAWKEIQEEGVLFSKQEFNGRVIRKTYVAKHPINAMAWTANCYSPISFEKETLADFLIRWLIHFSRFTVLLKIEKDTEFKDWQYIVDDPIPLSKIKRCSYVKQLFWTTICFISNRCYRVKHIFRKPKDLEIVIPQPTYDSTNCPELNPGEFYYLDEETNEITVVRLSPKEG